MGWNLKTLYIGADDVWWGGDNESACSPRVLYVRVGVRVAGHTNKLTTARRSGH